jgi:hypothetical protein
MKYILYCSKAIHSYSLQYTPSTNSVMSYPTKIRAVGINETGGVEVIQNLEVPFPEVKPTDLLVKVDHPSLSLSMMVIDVRYCLAG